jgi:hypothetical protein
MGDKPRKWSEERGIPHCAAISGRLASFGMTRGVVPITGLPFTRLPQGTR